MKCLSEGAHGVYGIAQWEKVNGELPYAYSIRDGVLHLMDVQRKDEGVYKCTMMIDGKPATVTHVSLKVSGKVNFFFSNTD